MRRLILALLLMAAGCAAVQAQTTVNLSVTDTPDSQTWNNGTWTVKLIPAPGNLSQTNSFTLLVAGGSLSSQSGTLSSTGTASMALPANINIGPAGTVWQFTVCSQQGTACYISNVTITTSSPQTVALTPPSIRVSSQPNLPPIVVYTTTEVSFAAIGSQITLVGSTPATPVLQICTAVSGSACTTWATAGSSPAGLNSATIYVGPTCPVANTSQCFFANFDVKTCFDGAVTATSPTVTTAGQCSFTQADVGKKIFVTNMCSASQCGFTLYEASITILPTQTTDTTIASVQSATSLTAAANASGTLASGATVAYGHDDTANLNAAYAALIALPGCGTLVMPGNAMAFFSGRIFTATTPTGACQSTDNIHSLSQVDLNALGPVIQGQGRNSTVLIPTPGFASSFASCSPACIGGGMQGMNWQHFAFAGLGQSFLGAGQNCATPFLVSGGNGGGALFDMGFSGWCTGSQGATAGVQIPQFTQVEFVTCTAFGAFCGGTSAQNVQISNSVWFSGRNGSFLNTGSVQSSNNEYYGPAQGLIGMDISGTFNSTNDIMLPVNGAPSNGASDIVVRNGAIFNAVNFTSSGGITGSFALNVVAGGTAVLNGFRVTAARTTSIQNAGTIIDLGGVIPNGPITNTASTAIYKADGHSVMGACTGVGTAASTLALRITGTSLTGAGIPSTCTSTTIDGGQIMQRAGNLETLTATSTAAGVNASSGVVTVLKNGSATTITCTIGTGTFCTDSTHVVAFVAGDFISMQFTTQAVDTLAGVKAYVLELN